jgi:hypothetical protein
VQAIAVRARGVSPDRRPGRIRAGHDLGVAIRPRRAAARVTLVVTGRAPLVTTTLAACIRSAR